VEVKKNNTVTATFTFDGDGKRVKSVMGSETILFVGGHYEIANPGSGQTVSKFYFAGASRIAMRKYTIPQSMAVEYLLGDHLGSTSITTDSSGNKVSEMRYKAWGEVRYSWTSGASTTPAYQLSSYTFTGQYSYMDDPSTSGVTEGFGLLFYNARMYDPAIGRFTSADTIIPPGVQGYDRYAYVNNSPVNYIDPSGHSPACDDGDWDGCQQTTDKPGCGVSGGGAYGFHCTNEDLDGANLQQRLDWFKWLTQNMNENIRPDASDWFNNIKTVVAGFSATGQDDSAWVLNVDVNILLAVQDGYAANRGYYSGPSFGAESGAGLWQNFFNALESPGVSDDTLIDYWGKAEQAGTNEGIAGTNAQPGLDDLGFTFIGNIYRGAGNTLCRIKSCVTGYGGFFDPRSTSLFGVQLGFSPVGLAELPIYFFDTFGYAFTGH